LVSCQSSQDESINGTYGHLPLDLLCRQTVLFDPNSYEDIDELGLAKSYCQEMSNVIAVFK